MSDDTAVLEVQNVQREQAKRATLEAMLGKKPKRDEFEFKLDPDSDPVSYLFVSIGAQEFEKLINKHPATTEQLADGAPYNIDTFAPALLARVCREPALDASEWKQVWTSEAWNRGEVMSLFSRAVNLCNQVPDVNPTVVG